jgi:hypothetical protein
MNRPREVAAGRAHHWQCPAGGWARGRAAAADKQRPAGRRRADDEKAKVAGGRYVRMEIGGIDSLARACVSVGRFGLVRAAVARAEERVRLSPTVVLYILLYILLFIEFSTRFSPLYLISLQQRFLNLVLYTLNPILETYFVPNFCTYVFIVPQMLWTYFIFI